MYKSSNHKQKQTLFTCLIMLAVVTSALGLAQPARAEGSKELVANGGVRALTEWRTSTYANFLPRRTLFKAYANAGETINLGSSAVGVGSGDIVVWTPGQITAPLTLALPTPAFICSSQSTTNGRMTTRAQELAGPLPNVGGYTPCTYVAPVTGIYNVAFYGPSGANGNTNGSAGTIASPNITATQNSGVSMWDITVRDSTNTTSFPGRVYTDYLTQRAGGNGTTFRVFSTLYAVTRDGFKYQVDLRGLDPNAYIFYGNTVGYLNPDGTTPLYHDLYDGVNDPLTSPQGGVTLAPPTSLLFFNSPDTSLPASIAPTPVLPLINSLTFQGSAGANLFGDAIPSNTLGTSGSFAYSGNVAGVFEIIIAPNPGLCTNANFDPNLATNRLLRAMVNSGTQNLAWDGKDNSGTNMPVSYPGNSGLGYCFKASLHAGEYHFPILDPENSMLGGPTITLLNPPGGTCPLATCRTAFFDDRIYTTTNGSTVPAGGTVGNVLPGNNPPPAPYYSLTGFDTASTTIRAFGNDTLSGFGDKKGMDLWTYYPSPDFNGRLYVVPVPNPQLGLTKAVAEASFTAAGQTLHYTLVATNAGNVPLNNVSITDARLGTLVCTPTQPATLAPSATLNCTGTYVTTQADVDAGKVDNTANASGTFNGTPVNAPPANATVPGVNNPHLSLAKVAAETIFTAAGQTLHYTLVATNDGNVTLSNVSITDAKLGTLTCTPAQPATLAPAATLSCTGTYVTVQADVDACEANNTAVENTANASGTFNGTPINAPPASASVPCPAPTPTLSLTKQVAEASFTAAGQTLHYTLVATNAGNVPLTNVSITDARLGTLVCTPTQPATLDLTATISCTGTYMTTQADVDAGKVDNTANASGTFNGTPVNAPPASASVPAIVTPQLGLTKVATEANFTAADQTLHYTLVATNKSNVPLVNVSITDTKLGNLVCTPTQPATLAPSATLSCTGTYVTIQADVDAGKVDNTANASGTHNGTPVNAPPASASVPAIVLTRLDLTKAVAESIFTGGQKLHYTLVATNKGNVPLANVSITDARLGTLTCTPSQPATLAPLGILSCKGTYLATQADVDAGKVDNTANASGTYKGTAVNSPPASASVPAPNVIAHLSLKKAPNESRFSKVGQTLHYTLVATNDGNVTLTAVSITDAKLGTLVCTPAEPATLAPSAKLRCTGTYVTTQADVDARKVDNTAYASGTHNGTPVNADPASASVPYKKTITSTPSLPSTGFAPDRVSLLPVQTVSYAALGDLWLEVPRLGIKTPIVGVPQTDEGWDVSWLGDQAGWLNGTAFPTWAGNSVLTGHVYDAFGQPGPFISINRLFYGDKIIIHAWGGSYEYDVREVLQVTPDAVSSVIKHEERPWVTLITCRDYDESSNSYRYRVAVRAVLVEVK